MTISQAGGCQLSVIAHQVADGVVTDSNQAVLDRTVGLPSLDTFL